MTQRVGPTPPPPPLIEETFWQITDVHMNPDYPKGCGNCASSFLNKSGCGTFADYYCGTSPALYTAAVQFMAQQNAQERIRPPAFVAHTGDIPDLPSGNVSALRAVARHQAEVLYQHFPTTPVFFAFGNHDFDPGAGDDCPYLPGCATHYAAICGAFGRDLDQAAFTSCAATGYFYVDNKVPGVRIVVLNTEFFGWEQGVDLSNRTHADAADAHLLWLEKAVAGAHGKVMILGHIPPASAYGMYQEGFTGGAAGYTEPGVQLWWQTHIERYNAIVAGSERVTVEIWGHLHMDMFFVPRGPPGPWKPPTGGARRVPTSVLWVGPSLAAWYPPKNGGVRRYSFSNATKQHVDSTVWYYDVDQSTATGQLDFRESWTASKDLFTNKPKHPIAPTDMLDLAMSWRTNHTAHLHARARGYLQASQSLYPDCSGYGFMDERCRMIDVCTTANPAPTELALCLMNWNCAVDDIARETRCMPRPAPAQFARPN